MHVCIYGCNHAIMHVYMYISMHASMYLCVYVCMTSFLSIAHMLFVMVGMTAYQIADRESFADVILVLSQFTTGFLGPLQVHVYINHTYIHTYIHIFNGYQVSRGRVNNIVSCPLGCGQRMVPRETAVS